MRFLFYVLLGSIILVGCTNHNESGDQKTLSVELTDTFRKFMLPGNWGHFNNNLFVDQNNTIHIFNHKNSLVSYSDQGEQWRHVEFELEGPNGVGNVQDIFFEADSSFWVVSQREKFFHLGPDMQILDKFAFDKQAMLEEGYDIVTFNFLKIEDEFYFPGIPMTFAWNTLSPEKVTGMPNLIKYNRETGVFEYLSFYDAEFIGSNLNKFIPPLIYQGANSKIIINHNYKNIFLFDGERSIRKEAAYSSFPINPPSSEQDIFDDMNELMRLIRFEDIYSRVFYFSQHQLYVRTAQHKETHKDPSGMEEHIAAKWGLVFLNEEFNKVGELELPESKFNPNYMFATAEGIWISTAHPDNPDLEEGVLQFQLLKLDQLSK